MSNREQEPEAELASMRPYELEDRIRQLEAEVRKLTEENRVLRECLDYDDDTYAPR